MDTKPSTHLLPLLPVDVPPVWLQSPLSARGARDSDFSGQSPDVEDVGKKFQFFKSLCGSDNLWVGPGVQTLTSAYFFS